jgi:hypothetical protein
MLDDSTRHSSFDAAAVVPPPVTRSRTVWIRSLRAVRSSGLIVATDTPLSRAQSSTAWYICCSAS